MKEFVVLAPLHLGLLCTWNCLWCCYLYLSTDLNILHQLKELYLWLSIPHCQLLIKYWAGFSPLLRISQVSKLLLCIVKPQTHSSWEPAFVIYMKKIKGVLVSQAYWLMPSLLGVLVCQRCSSLCGAEIAMKRGAKWEQPVKQHKFRKSIDRDIVLIFKTWKQYHLMCEQKRNLAYIYLTAEVCKPIS